MSKESKITTSINIVAPTLTLTSTLISTSTSTSIAAVNTQGGDTLLMECAQCKFIAPIKIHGPVRCSKCGYFVLYKTRSPEERLFYCV